jgi:aspartate 1-decarboxylase
MMIEMLKSKIHRATVTGAELDYTGSVAIDPALCEPGEICVNGAAARLVHRGDRVIIAAYAQLDEDEAESFRTENHPGG